MKSEKEKANDGVLYNANFDSELIAEREQCKLLCFEYNQLNPLEKEKRNNLIVKMLGKTGSTFLIEPPFYCDYGYNIEIGDNFYANHNCIILDGVKVIFGNNVFIGPGCGFYTAGHPLNVHERNEGLEFAHPITIGNNVWIGAQSVILPGVNIGDNTVIGAGSVVTKNIPDNIVAVGNPCRVIRLITSVEKI